MKSRDFKVGVGLLVICGVFFSMISKLPEQAALYPTFVTGILAVLSLVFTGKALMNKTVEDDGVLKGVEIKQLGGVLLACFLYVAGIRVLGYFTTTFLYFLAVLYGFKISKKQNILVSVGFCLFIFVLFKVFLKVPLPKGMLI